MKFSKENVINYLLLILFFLQPILDIFYLNNNSFEIFGFQLSTLIRLSIFAIISFLFILKFKNLKFKKIFIGYLILNILYFIIHYWNAMNFNSYIPGNLNFSVFEEVFYYIRMIIPIFLIYYIFNSNNVKEKDFNNSIYICVGIIIFSIFISNIFKFSLCSYSDNIISGNILDWFINPGKFGYLSLASRGIFNNIIVYYLVILLLPYIIYLFFTNEGKKNFINYIFIIIAMFSSFMAGTKATTLGFIILIVCSFLLNLFFSIIKKENKFLIRKNLFLICIIFFSIFMIDYSPMTNRNVTDKKIENNKQEQVEDEKNSIIIADEEEITKYLTKEEKKTIKEYKDEKLEVEDILNVIQDESVKKIMLVDILSNNYYYYGFNLKFIETAYSYKYDPIFWKNLIDSTYYYERSNNRMVVRKIFDRIFEVNNNSYDKYFGITYSRTSKVFNLERDFLYQYYSMGIVGCILLLGPYIFIVLFSGIYMLIHYKTKLNLKNCSLLLGIGLTLCLAFYSGNTLENLTITIPLGIVSAFLLKNILSKD